MKKQNLILAIFPLVFSGLFLEGQTVNIVANAGAGKFQLAAGGDVTDGSSYEFGHFNSAGYTGDNSYSALSTLFTFVGTGITSSNGEFQASGIPISGGTPGQPLYALVYDSANGQIGIFSSDNSLWNYPAGTGFATMSNSAGTITEFITSNTALNLTAIPEPSTYAAIFGTLALAGVIYHRRKKRG